MIGLIMAAMVAGPNGGSTGAAHCQQVHARYEIYANHDGLRVFGSRHVLYVVVDALDKELQARGWENTVAIADFTLCAHRPIDARGLTSKDIVRVSGFRGVRYVRRR